MKNLIFSVLLLFCSQPILAFDLGVGVSKPFDKTQDNSGSDETDPYSPTISVGHTWTFFTDIHFAPRFGYIRQTNTTNDRYGGDYKVESLYLLYDFLHPLSAVEGLSLRYGFGTFQKRTSGEGGTVTVPNGSGTATAYRPGSSKPSNTLSLNVGLDYEFGYRASLLEKQGLRAELFLLQPFDKQKRLFATIINYFFIF